MVDVSVSEPKEKSHGWRILRLKANKKGTHDVFTGSFVWRNVSLMHLENETPEERYK